MSPAPQKFGNCFLPLFLFSSLFALGIGRAVTALHLPVQQQAHHGAQREGGCQRHDGFQILQQEGLSDLGRHQKFQRGGQAAAHFMMEVVVVVEKGRPHIVVAGFGQAGELNLEYTFEKLFGFGFGKGYPADRVEAEQSNKKILDGVRAVAFKPLIEILKGIDQDLLKGAIAGEHFQEQFFADCKDPELAAYVKTLL